MNNCYKIDAVDKWKRIKDIECMNELTLKKKKILNKNKKLEET